MHHPEDAVLINGRFLMQAVTGVQRVARELVVEIDRLIGEGAIKTPFAIACAPHADVSDLNLQHITIERRGGASGHLWEQWILPKMVSGRRLLCLGNTAPFFSALSGNRISVMIHDVSYLSMPQAYAAKYRWAHRMLLPILMRCADPIFTVAVSEAERLKRLGSAANARIIPIQNGGLGDGLSENAMEKTGTIPRERMALYVGSLSRRKNVERIIEVAHKLAREDNVRTVFVGSSHEILAPIRGGVASDVQHMLEFVGHASQTDVLAGYYRRASCLLFPSLYEASPLPPIEAMSLGCPVVASAIPSMTERCGNAAIYCDPYDTEDILHAARRIFNESGFADDLREKGYIRASGFSWRQQAVSVLSAMNVS